MNDGQAKELCLALMKADSEQEVIALLKEAGFWDNKDVWRFYGDYENNYNTIGNQQSRPDAALVEKVVNAVDATLLGTCLERGIDPEGPDAPQSIREAVAMFFDNIYKPDSPHAGQVKNWPDEKRTQTARWLTLSATGFGPTSGNPCFTISDRGEGQTPERMPDTFLSLTKSNKLRIPFVQGKFNMGGTGVFEFCGQHGLQLIVTRRNPAILNRTLAHPSDAQWGFTIVRRENAGAGPVRSSVYTYLAPLGVDQKPGQGGVIRFSADKMPIFPQGRDPYARESEWGTLVKLYEYAATGFRSNILMRDGLLSRMDLLLPDVALPVRLYECRKSYKGHQGSFENNLTGLGVRLEDDRGNNLEEGFPSSCPIRAMGEQMTATIYAFKKGKAESYRKHEGIIFTLNGQTHGHLTLDFFTRKAVGLSYLADSILVMVDCSRFTGRARELLFMNSRDRLRNGELKHEIERALEEMLKQHQGLRELKERRRREQTEAKLADSKPLEDILESLLKKSPTLANLFLKGRRASNPFKTVKVREEGEKPFVGKRFPTFFKLKGKDYGQELIRETPINMRSRIAFETDAENDYFGRATETGQFSLFLVKGENREPVTDYVGPNLQNGIGTLSVQLPPDCQVGHMLSFVAVVTDATRIDPFENRFAVKIKPAAPPSGSAGERRKPPDGEPGEDREVPMGIALPNIIPVYEKDWEAQTPRFDRFTALQIKNAGDDGAENADVKPIFDFYVNMDNVYLKTELKLGHRDPEVTRARFTYGLVLLGLALVQENEAAKTKPEVADAEGEEEENEGGEVNIERRVAEFTRAVAPVLLPMIESLGDLDDEPAPSIGGSGEPT
ncbi:MAG: hypothetical protein GYA33_07945 [Thermogutta sp.]|nr:hypothetical protein [Thermogutta sp.]